MSTDNPTPRPTSSDPTAALRAAVRQGVLGLLVLTVVAAAVASAIAGLEGLWGALLGAAVGGGFVVITAIVVLLTARSEPTVMGAAVLGSFLLKILVFIGVVAVLRDLEFYSHPTFVIVIAIEAIAVLALETRAVLSTNVPYVAPHSEDAA
ncbi:hypothetical protein [Rhodococcus sp. X156]|uniref:hypothetical protein n=1 Tax=Rhodococcus sp. X156 TaxID=2499145 RepID=UPI000FD7882A|nr:hypothetical protein [Rhodococcus sp. X156]